MRDTYEDEYLNSDTSLVPYLIIIGLFNDYSYFNSTFSLVVLLALTRFA